MEAEHQQAPLPVLLEHADNLTKEAGYYTAAAVHDARMAGSGWEAVAAAAGVSVSTARGWWGERKVKRLLARRARQQCLCLSRRGSTQRPAEAADSSPAGGDEGCTPSGRASRKLVSALSHMQRNSGMTIHDAAQQADLSPSYVSRILAGDRVPNWPVVHMLATIFGGRAQELRALWESAQGVSYPARQGVHSAAQRLQDALRGLYLAASCPELTRGRDRGLTTQAAGEALRGEVVPDWPTTSALITWLGGHPADVRPLWEDVHYAFLTSHDVFPCGGLPRSHLPEPEADDGPEPGDGSGAL
ncbi:helix-turn-helix transcriptional regulator [Streptomyces sp. NPDC048611]|uniref:helix-turn-helix domain-containing protein n=1 Tax=Streptomyces sp. NPDC048611 TaxID=3155635 RepID=UPI00342D729D